MIQVEAVWEGGDARTLFRGGNTLWFFHKGGIESLIRVFTCYSSGIENDQLVVEFQ